MDLLPDCRLTTRPAGVNRGLAGTWLPVFCANCGADGGLVPEGATFLFYLCNTCAATYGQVAGTMLMPDEIFFQRLAEAQLERYGRYLRPAEWAVIGENPSHPLHVLLRDYPR